MKKLSMTAAALAALIFSGCTSVTTVQGDDLNGQKLSRTSKTIAHVNVQNWGIYLFSLPLLTGDPEKPGSVCVFRDTVNLRATVPALTEQSRKLGGTKVLDMASQYSDGGFIFCKRDLNISADVVK